MQNSEIKMLTYVCPSLNMSKEEKFGNWPISSKAASLQRMVNVAEILATIFGSKYVL